jgi:hypothetical protein
MLVTLFPGKSDESVRGDGGERERDVTEVKENRYFSSL